MLCDQNKTELSRFVTAAAVRWMTEHGFKPVETEVGVAPGWIADVAGAICPTRSEASDLKLIPRSLPYGSANRNDRERQRELAFDALPTMAMTGIVEVKTSRSDFTTDRKWALQRPADLCYLAVPLKLIQPSEYPAGWGVVEFEGEYSRLIRPAMLADVGVEQRLSVVVQVAMRRDNATRFERLRALSKAQRQQENGYVNRRRVSDCLRAVLDVFHGKRTPDEAIEYARIHPSYAKDSLEELKLIHGLGPKFGVQLTDKGLIL